MTPVKGVIMRNRDRASRAGTARRSAVSAGLLAALLLLVAPAAGSGPLGTSDTPAAPSFTIKTMGGEKLSLQDLLAEGPVLLDFWATWCKPCKEALPKLETLHQRYASRGLTVIGISADGPRNFSKVRPFVTRLGLTYPIAMDETGSLQKNYRVIGLPTTVLIDTTGAIVHTVAGFRPGEEHRLAEWIESLLPPAADEPEHQSPDEP